jgi:hypothetical protein
MYGLTEAEVNAMLTSTDAAVAGAAKKLKAAEEAGEFIPKSRLAKEIQEAKEAQAKLAAIEAAQKTAEDERMRKNGEIEKLLESERTDHAKTKAERDAEKKEADEYRKLRKATIESYKKQLGDKWRDSYETLPLEDLAVIAGQQIPILGVITAGGKPPEVPSEIEALQKQVVEAQKAGRIVDVVALRNKISALQQQKT